MVERAFEVSTALRGSVSERLYSAHVVVNGSSAQADRTLRRDPVDVGRIVDDGDVVDESRCWP